MTKNEKAILVGKEVDALLKRYDLSYTRFAEMMTELKEIYDRYEWKDE